MSLALTRDDAAATTQNKNKEKALDPRVREDDRRGECKYKDAGSRIKSGMTEGERCVRGFGPARRGEECFRSFGTGAQPRPQAP